VEAHLADGERPPRQRDLGALDGKRRAAAPIGDAQALERERGSQPPPSTLDAPHRHGRARRLLDRGDDIGPVVVDGGKRDVAQPKHQRGEGDDEEGRGARCQAENDSR
jgi:hypothetical protein